ncbi:hypothetical protein K439DRAFT_1649598 [Ramaria rubella]|nr:hypothetical protein K439DRAFT_1649598 [Ramaria rubella]
MSRTWINHPQASDSFQRVKQQQFSFDPSVAPSNSKFKTPSWVRRAPVTPVNSLDLNGLGEPFEWSQPTYRGIDLRKPDPRLRVPQYEINSPNSQDGIILFCNVNILDSTGREPYLGDVLVRGNRIASVGPKVALESVESDAARIIEGNGRTLMSGLVDAHTHFTWTNAGSLNALGEMATPNTWSSSLDDSFLDCGYTMCLGAASAKQRIDCVIRDAINEGTIPGPRFLANAKEIAPRDGSLVDDITAFADTPEELAQIIKDNVTLGIDQIKLSMSGEEITERLRAEDTTFKDECVAAAVELAHEAGIRVCSHARSDESIIQCLQYGVDIIYHASFISDATMDALEAQKERVFVAPGINWLYATLYDAEAYGYGPAKAEAAGYRRELEVSIAALKEMHARGIRILPGGDYGLYAHSYVRFAWSPHGTYRDLEHFVKLLDYTPMDAILAGTALGGELMMRPNELGKVQPGFFADLILVDGNPLENINLLSDQKNVSLVMINGHIHKDHLKDRAIL